MNNIKIKLKTSEKVYVVVYEGDALGVYLTPEAATLAGCALEDEEFIVSECTFHGEEE
jgi:hypothetical protein